MTASEVLPISMLYPPSSIVGRLDPAEIAAEARRNREAIARSSYPNIPVTPEEDEEWNRLAHLARSVA